MLTQVSRFQCVVLAAVAYLAVMGAKAQAALLTGNAVTSPTNPANLTQLGSTDWAYWSSGAATVSSMAPTNAKNGGPGLIGAATPVAGTGVRGSSNDTAIRFTFTDGTSTAAGTNIAVKGVFNAALDTVNTGVQVSVTLPDTQLYQVSIWVSGFNSTGTFTASLPGVANYQDAGFSYGSGPPSKPARLYELHVQANQPGDILTLSHVMTTDLGGTAASSHVLIAGIALTVIPEPASLLLLLPAATLLLRPGRTP